MPRLALTASAVLAVLSALTACSKPVRTEAILPVTASDSAASDSTPQLAPAGWARAGAIPTSYRLGLDSTVTHGGTASAFIESIGNPGRGVWGALIQQIDASAYAGQRIRIGAFIRRRESGPCEAFVRVDGGVDSNSVVLAFVGNDQKRLRCGRAWTEHAFILQVPDSAERIVYGFGLRSRGRMWVDDVGLIVVDSTVTPDRQPSGLPRRATPSKAEAWDPLVIGGKEKPDSTARPTNLGFEK